MVTGVYLRNKGEDFCETCKNAKDIVVLRVGHRRHIYRGSNTLSENLLRAIAASLPIITRCQLKDDSVDC